MQQEHGAHQCDDGEFLGELVAQMGDRALDQPRAVVGLDDFDARRQALLQLLQFCLDRYDRLQRVLA